MTLFPRRGLFRPLEGGAFAAANAVVTGDATLGEDVGIWFGCVVRGDDAPLTIGRRTNIQDLTMIHADTGVPNTIGAEVTVGHRCVLHGAEIADRCLIGMGAILLGGSRIGEGSIVGAGAVVKEGMEVPPRSLVVGIPGRIVRQVTDEEVALIGKSAEGYVRKIRLYLEEGAGSAARSASSGVARFRGRRSALRRSPARSPGAAPPCAPPSPPGARWPSPSPAGSTRASSCTRPARPSAKVPWP